MQESCNQAYPPGLVTRTYACTVIAVDVFRKQPEILPMRIGLKHLRVSVDRTYAFLVYTKDIGQPVAYFVCYFEPCFTS